MKVRDRRKDGWFRVDDEIIEVYGPKIGVHGIAVYSALAKYANKEEEAYPGLRRLCKELKIGRGKLLSTLTLLKEIDLIDIEAGDRKHVNVYTLLEVPKKGGSNQNQGGSNENHVGDQGGSNENQGGSEQHQGGGSGENQNQTHREPDPIEPDIMSSEDFSSLPDDITSKCLLALKKVKGFPRDQAENAIYLAELRTEFPSVDAVEVCRRYQIWHRDNPNKTKNYRSRLRTFFENNARDARNGKRGGKHSIAVTEVTEDDYREEDYNFHV